MPKLLEGKSAVVTGGGRGQGREIALAMAREGAKVVVNDLGTGTDGIGSDRAPADEVVAEIRKAGGTAVANYDSVADFAAAEKIINTCVQNFGGIDILVNCAAVIRGGMIWEMSEEDWDLVLAFDLKGTFNTCRHACALMVKQGAGRIINFASDAWRGLPSSTTYCTAKGGVVSLTRTIAKQMALAGHDKITCNAICPAARTRIGPQNSPDMFERAYKAGLVEKWLYEGAIDPSGPEVIPPIVLYLAMDEAVNINGRVFGASGGRIALYSQPVQEKGLYKEGVWTFEELVKLIPGNLV